MIIIMTTAMAKPVDATENPDVAAGYMRRAGRNRAAARVKTEARALAGLTDRKRK
jgi:hypothetical protein